MISPSAMLSTIASDFRFSDRILSMFISLVLPQPLRHLVELAAELTDFVVRQHIDLQVDVPRADLFDRSVSCSAGVMNDRMSQAVAMMLRIRLTMDISIVPKAVLFAIECVCGMALYSAVLVDFKESGSRDRAADPTSAGPGRSSSPLPLQTPPV